MNCERGDNMSMVREYTEEESTIIRKINNAVAKAIMIERRNNNHGFEFVDYVVDAMQRTARAIRDELIEI
jgi:hypothetical protein